MCTVSFVPSAKTVILTSNRDEKATRTSALLPGIFSLSNGQKIIYPTDGEAGGTWIALKNSGDAAILLNGAFYKHVLQPSYRRSRGLVFREIIGDRQPLQAFREINLNNIEPFTLILFVHQHLVECRWDGKKRFEVELNNNKAHIWSSATLYDTATQKLREEWFKSFLNQHPEPTQQSVLAFHLNGGVGDRSIDICMNRGKVKTISITSILVSPDGSNLRHFDLERRSQTTKTFSNAERLHLQ